MHGGNLKIAAKRGGTASGKTAGGCFILPGAKTNVYSELVFWLRTAFVWKPDAQAK
jgi:hypothetical protein